MEESFYQKIMEKHDDIYFKGTYFYEIIRNMGKENSLEEKFLRDIFYQLVYDLNDNEYAKKLLISIVQVTGLLKSKIEKLDEASQKEFYENLYDVYIKALLLTFSNGDYESVRAFFLQLNEKMKLASGFYGLYGHIDDTYEDLEKQYLQGGRVNAR